VNGRRWLVAVAAGAALLSASSLGAAAFVKSPAQVAAEAAAPAPSLLTAPVERRVLRDTVVVRGTVSAERSVEVTPSGARDGREPVVTGVRVRRGSQVRAGAVLVEVSGRPLIALPGRIPSYRDLRPGARGKDIAQLQAALDRLGHDVADRHGVFGAGTKRAMVTLYAALGYEPATTGEDDERAVVAARRAVRQAERALARTQLSAAGSGAGLAGGDKAGDGSAAGAALDEADARAELAVARADLAALERRSGVMLPAAEVVFLPGFPARVDRLAASVGGPVTAPLVVLSAGQPVVRASLPPPDRSLVKVGQRVRITAEALGITAAARVASVADATGGVAPPATGPAGGAGAGTGSAGKDAATGGGSAAGGEDAPDPGGSEPDPGTGPAADQGAGPDPGQDAGIGITVTGSRPLDARLIGQDVRLTIESASTGRPVLVVPLAAVSSTAAGDTQVIKVGTGGRQERIGVTVGPSGDGYLEVRPTGGALTAGDRVVIGQ
jgi:peptidoglycan hydrolase-like protein with peptidoglycan-binding domain